MGLEVALKGSYRKESPLRLLLLSSSPDKLLCCCGQRLFSEISLSPLLCLPKKSREGTLGCLRGACLRGLPEPLEVDLCVSSGGGAGCFRDTVHRSVLGDRVQWGPPAGSMVDGGGFYFQLQVVWAPPWKAVCLPSPHISAGRARWTLFRRRTSHIDAGACECGRTSVHGEEDGGPLGGEGTQPGGEGFLQCLCDDDVPPASGVQIA